MRRSAGLAGTLLLVAALSTLPVDGAQRWHVVAYGDSVSAIAEHYYGDHAFADLLLRFNDRSDPGIRPGERLRVPYCPVHIVKRGDSGSLLAQRFLGSPSAWTTIAELNGLSPDDPLRVGDSLVMPVILGHALSRGESLAVLAERYYGDASRSRLLQAFNHIEDPRELSVGRTIDIPLITLRLAEQPPATEPAPAAPEPEPEPVPEPAHDAAAVEATPAWFEDGLAEAERAYSSGEFEVALKRVSTLSERVEAISLPADRARLWRLSAFVHVAFDRTDDACAAYRSLESVASPVEFDPDLVSPKIRETLAACSTDEDS